MSPEEATQTICEILYPEGDLDHEWSVDDLERIAEVVNAWKEGQS